MTKKYKIVYCTPSLYIPGGVERVLTTKANYFADVLGYDIYIVLTDGKGKTPYYPLSSKIHLIYLDINFEELWNKKFIYKSLLYLKKQSAYKRELTRILIELKPDITISLLRREINFITSIKDGSKKIGEIHINRKHYRNFERHEINIFKSLFSKIWMYQLITKLNRLDKFIVLTEDDKHNWIELNNVNVIPNPLIINDDIASLDNKEIIAVGRYSYEKGFDLLINAWTIVYEYHKDWRLSIYGTGNKENLLPLLIEKNLSDSVNLQDSSHDIFNKYFESSVFVCSSRFEGFGMVLAEAMSCGVPVVSFDCPYGPRNIINNGVDGILVKNGDVAELAKSIMHLIDNPIERKRMGALAKHNIKRLDVIHICKKWDELFNSLLSNR